MDGSPPGSAIPGILQARTLQWVAIPSPMHESESEIAQSCPTLRDSMDCSLPGSSAHGIFQARVLEWGAIAFSVYEARNPNNRGSNTGSQGSSAPGHTGVGKYLPTRTEQVGEALGHAGSRQPQGQKASETQAANFFALTTPCPSPGIAPEKRKLVVQQQSNLPLGCTG